MGKYKSLDLEFMNVAVRLSARSLTSKSGGPFGAVVVKDGRIIGRGYNRVLASNDATAHAEVDAIRKAGKKLGNYDLSGCDLYTSCEPCPMCLMAIKWANIRNIYYAATRADADKIGFRDSHLYELLKPNTNSGIFVDEAHAGAVDTMNMWHRKNPSIIY